MKEEKYKSIWGRRETVGFVIRCVIIDDTALPKTGFKTEKIGKVFSHTQMKPILGFNLQMAYPSFSLIFLSIERKENEAISHRGYPRNGQRPAIARNIRRMNVFPDVALSILQVELRRPSACSNAQS